MKNQIVKALSLILVLLLGLVIVGCEEKIDINKIAITANPEKTELVKGDVIKLNVEVTGTEDKGVSYIITDQTLVAVADDVLTVIGEVEDEKSVTVLVVSDANPKKNVALTFNIKNYVAPSIEIKNSRNTITLGETITLQVVVNGLTNKAYGLQTSHPDIISISNNDITVIKEVSADTKVTITAISVEDTSVVATKEFLVKAASSLGQITINASQDTIKEDETIMLSATVVGLTSTEVVWTVSDETLVKIENGVLSLIGSVKVDTNITVTATSKIDESVFKSKTITIIAPIVEGQVGYLNATVLGEIANPAITFSGKVTDYYNDLRNTFNSTVHTYDSLVMMSEGRWYGAWNITGDIESRIVDNYRKGDVDGVIDEFGATGHALESLYIDKNNQVAAKTIKNYKSIPTIWESQHLWNHLGNLSIKDFVYSAEDGKHTYTLKTNDVDAAYLMTYLSYSLTPMLSDTLQTISFIIENDHIVKIIGRTEMLYYGANTNEDPDAVSYTEIELVPSNIGTTVVPEPAKYEATEYDELLKAAITKMQQAENYTYQAVDTTTYAPSGDSGDYELAGSSTTPTTKLYKQGSRDSFMQLSSVKNNVSSTGTVGDRGWVTKDAILIAKTTKYNYASDDKVYKTEYSGYKANNDNTYDEFVYDTGLQTLAGKRKVNGLMTEVLPTFDFASEIFEFVSTKGSGNNTTYTFKLRANKAVRDVALAATLSSTAKDANEDIEVSTTIVVDKNGNLVSFKFPYNINSTYYGYINVSYIDVNTTVIPEGTFDGYVARVWRTDWSLYTCKYYSATHSTKDSHDENAKTVFEKIFEESYSDLPSPEVFVKVFDDIVYGPFYNWKDGPNGTFIDYVSINVESSEFDENSQITNYEELMNELIFALQEEGYTLDESNTDTSGGKSGYGDRYVTLTKGGVEIVVTNNRTKHLSIYFYKIGEWILKK